MKKNLLTALALFFVHLLGSAVLVVEGRYLNKNIYVNNGVSSSGVGFCAREVRVNGATTTDETNSSTFEIDLKALHLKYGDKVVIEISHGEGCLPKILNMEDLKPLPTFEVVSIELAPTGILKWTTKKESGSLPYIVEQFKWNKWVPVGEVDGLGTPETHQYTFKVTMHSGMNKYRVRQKGLNSTTKLSKEVVASSTLTTPSYAISKNLASIDFTTETAFEVYDAYGNIVKKGFGKQVSIDNLHNGAFYLCYDNLLTEFKK